MYSEVTFYSDGLKIAAYLYPPKDWQPGDPARPAIVSLHGYSGMKDVYGLDVPRRLSEEGYFVLAPDNRGFGKSEGARGRHRPLEQAQDTYDAITYLETVPGVDPERIGIYGTSFGGANAIWVAAFDKRVKVVVSSVGVHDGERWMRSVRRPHEWYTFQQQVWEAARRRVTTGERTMWPLGDIMLIDPHTLSVIEAHHQKDPRWVGEFDLESAEACWRYRPEWVAPRIAPRPVLIIYAEYDGIVPVEEALSCYEACGEPKKLVKLPKAQHYESYYFVNPEVHEIGMSEAVAWYKRFL
ncbi:MAG: alpha/beta hydrolase [Nitrospinota bacterium]